MGDSGAGFSEMFQANQPIGLTPERIAALNVQARERLAAQQAEKDAQKGGSGDGGVKGEGKEAKGWGLRKIFGRKGSGNGEGDVVR